jgi:hypothetical protein
MTGRAIIWCGHLKRNNALDPVAFRNDVEIAHRAALRRGVAPGSIWALVCDESLLPDEFSGTLYSPAWTLSTASHASWPRPRHNRTASCSSLPIIASLTAF